MEPYVSLSDAGQHFGVKARSIKNWGEAGKFPLYRLPGGRTLRVRLSEVEAAMRTVPCVSGQG
jgi:predicted site-specific integrase-resolvase